MSAATLAVAGEGMLSIDEPVDRLLPELAGANVLGAPSRCSIRPLTLQLRKYRLTVTDD